MCVVSQIRKAGKKFLGPRAASYVHRLLHEHPAARSYRSALRQKHGLEIGGPSGIFGDAGPFPVYQVLASLDNCLYSAQTIWTGDVPRGRGFQYHPLKRPGNQIICEAAELQSVEDSAYECVLGSHCLEHVANPLRALGAWKRVLQPDGILLLVLPHKDGTFDRKRPTTSLAHMIEDYRNGIKILALHDLEKDEGAGSKDNFERRCMQNYSNRAIHHHVFDTATAIALVNYAAFKIMRVDTSIPCHIVILARGHSGAPDNATFLRRTAECYRRSPFPSDQWQDGG